MNQPPQTEKQTGKRIVSKGEYVKRQGIRAGLGVIGMGLFLLTILCGVVAMILLLWFALGVWVGFLGCNLSNFNNVLIRGLAALILGGVTYLFDKGNKATIRQAQKLGEMQMLTRANIADLPVPDTLVRASEEPRQEEAVLLRAASETQERHEEQLVRAVAGGTQ